jgi:hypothetical protein
VSHLFKQITWYFKISSNRRHPSSLLSCLWMLCSLLYGVCSRATLCKLWSFGSKPSLLSVKLFRRHYFNVFFFFFFFLLSFFYFSPLLSWVEVLCNSRHQFLALDWILCTVLLYINFFDIMIPWVGIISCSRSVGSCIVCFLLQFNHIWVNAVWSATFMLIVCRLVNLSSRDKCMVAISKAQTKDS